MFSAVQWPMLVSLLVWVVPGLLPVSERELECPGTTPILDYQGFCATLNFSTNTASSVTGPLYAP